MYLLVTFIVTKVLLNNLHRKSEKTAWKTGDSSLKYMNLVSTFSN